jgi:hypothetical protein
VKSLIKLVSAPGRSFEKPRACMAPTPCGSPQSADATGTYGMSKIELSLTCCFDQSSEPLGRVRLHPAIRRYCHDAVTDLGQPIPCHLVGVSV